MKIPYYFTNNKTLPKKQNYKTKLLSQNDTQPKS